MTRCITERRRSERRFLLACVLAAGLVRAGQCQSYPVPALAGMPLEEMQIRIVQVGTEYRADFGGQFTFDHIPTNVASMEFPVPIGASQIAVHQGGGPVS